MSKLSSLYAVFGGAWAANIPPHLAQLPMKGDIVIGNDVWIGRESIIMPGVKIGDGGTTWSLKWWDFSSDKLVKFLPVLCNSDLPSVKQTIEDMLK